MVREGISMMFVLGLYRGGSSCVAGVLHHLGVCMGHEIKRIPHTAGETVPYVCWEDWSLRRACRECYSEPELDARAPFHERVRILREWRDRRIDTSRRRVKVRAARNVEPIPYDGCDCSIIGAKYPMLCYMGPELESAFGDGVTYVSVYRDVETTATSLERWYGAKAHELSDKLYDARAQFLSGHDHISVDYDDMLTATEEEVERLAYMLPISPSAEQVQAAIESVKRPGEVSYAH